MPPQNHNQTYYYKNQKGLYSSSRFSSAHQAILYPGWTLANSWVFWGVKSLPMIPELAEITMIS